ncbi:hypothetical protein PRK78_005694 [Emydomyces testavorans]|uniref:MARVEL domain-containing protein n=1 Tax=Emydomyces testavorans TaxID=2070801 RepID=A0AAF0IMW0_9EURO|nr:hypothetical protein PRK78_005694 [Emydomyces testavorans]
MVPMKPLNLFLRGLEVAFATIVMGLVGNILNDLGGHSQSTLNYVMFTVAFALATLLYLIAANASDTFMIHPVILFVVDLLNTIFIFCAAVALPSKLHVPNCNRDSQLLKNTITSNSRSLAKSCREAKASSAFLWFLWFCFLISTILSGINMTGGWMGMPQRAQRRAPRVAQPPPTMSQV